MTKKNKLNVKPSTRSDDGTAFLPDPYSSSGHQPMRSKEQLSETLAEEFVASATSGEPVHEDLANQVTPEEVGGPFLQIDARREFAETVDEMNPEDAPREPFPTATRSLG